MYPLNNAGLKNRGSNEAHTTVTGYESLPVCVSNGSFPSAQYLHSSKLNTCDTARSLDETHCDCCLLPPNVCFNPNRTPAEGVSICLLRVLCSLHHGPFPWQRSAFHSRNTRYSKVRQSHFCLTGLLNERNCRLPLESYSSFS